MTEDSSSTGEEDDSILGESASVKCTQAMDQLVIFQSALATALQSSPVDVSSARTAYVTTPLQYYIQDLDALHERNDDQMIMTAFAQATAESLIDVESHLYLAASKALRTYVAAPELGSERPHADWDEAHCLWTGALRSLAVEAEEMSPDNDYEDVIAADVDMAFQTGHEGITETPSSTWIDDWSVQPSKQIIEKNQFRAAHRLVLYYAEQAQKNADPLAARRAYGFFQILRDRMQDRNDTGIEIIETMLENEDLQAIDVSAILREMNVAFANRTRKYCSSALDNSELASPTGYRGAVEGATYVKVILPHMIATLGEEGFLAQNHLDTWARWTQLVKDGEDLQALQATSKELIDWNCLYQTQVLMVPQCSTDNAP